MLSFRVTATAANGARLQDTLHVYLPYYILFLSSRNKHAKFDVNWYLRSRAVSKYTHVNNLNLSFKIRFVLKKEKPANSRKDENDQ